MEESPIGGRAGELTQGLKDQLAAPPADPWLIPSTHVVAHNHLCLKSQEIQWPSLTSASIGDTGGAQTCM